MEIHDRDIDDVHIVAPVGSIDAVSAPELSGHIQGLIAAGSVKLVADFTEVDYTSSAGLRVLLGAVKETRAMGGDIRLASVRPDVMKVLTLSGFASILQIFDDVEAAVGSFT